MVLKDTRPLTRLGFPSSLTLTKANLSDDAGLIEMLSKNIDYFKSKPVNIPKITILLDRGYHPEHLTVELKKIYPQIISDKLRKSANCQGGRQKKVK